jgi:serine phosphatase RsbU (regulator of sigma subunit)
MSFFASFRVFREPQNNMMKNHVRFDLWLLAFAAAGLIVTIWLFPQTYPQASLQGSCSRREIIRQAEIILNHAKGLREGLEPVIDFRPNPALLAFGQVNFGAVEANRLFSRDLPAFFWNVRYGKPPLMKSLMSSGTSEAKLAEVLVKHMLGESRVQLDTHGRLLSFDTFEENPQDTSKLSSDEAQALAFGLVPFSALTDTTGMALEKSQMTKQKTRLDHTFVWKVPAPIVGLKAQLAATIQGAHIRRWQLNYTPLAIAEKSDWTFKILGQGLTIFLLIIGVIFFFIKKLRADELSLKAGLPAGILMAIALVLYFLTNATVTFSVQLLEAVIAPGFVILGFVILYGTGESLMRNLGQDRLLSFEAAQHGQLWFRPLGDALWRGAAASLILFGGVTILLNRFSVPAQAYFTPKTEMDALIVYSAFIPSLSALGESLYYTLFAEAAYRLFLVSALARFVQKPWLIVALTALLSSFSPVSFVEWSPFSFVFLINFLLGLALTWLYLRFDFLTTVIAALSLPMLMYGLSFLHAGQTIAPIHGWFLIMLPALFLIGGQVIRRYGQTEIDARALQPDYLDRLAEKERVKRELEIARQVQLSFLPRQLPKITGLDIAALCIPANEVGGDYYDFVQLGDKKLGVLIGDVSGKGVSAAFYMTLTKGIIKSSVQESLSPAQVLTRANRLFYENVDRGIFVSLIYGVFDLEKRTFTSARAGHNPILLLRRQEHSSTFVSPHGLALGLDHGEIFSRNIQEQTQVLNNGDAFVFYTDGFTEAMNERKEEFGEKRMIDVLSNGIGVSSQDTINNIRNAVQIFAGVTAQHDDMTMVVVKVL